MPHITIEYSSNIVEHHDVEALLAAVHEAALAHGLPPADGLRTRAVARTDYRIADGSEDLAFIAIAVRIGPGRDAAAKTSFIEAILNAAETHVESEAGPVAIAWSVELTEIDPEFRINRNHVRTRLAQRATSTPEAQSHG